MNDLMKKIYFGVLLLISQVLFAQGLSDEIKLIQVNVEGNQADSQAGFTLKIFRKFSRKFSG